MATRWTLKKRIGIGPNYIFQPVDRYASPYAARFEAEQDDPDDRIEWEIDGDSHYGYQTMRMDANSLTLSKYVCRWVVERQEEATDD